MEKDKLKDFIQENKEEFDFIEAGESTWMGIDEELSKRNRFSFDSKSFLRIAASIFLILGAAWIGIQINNSETNGAIAEEEANTEEAIREYAFSGMSDELVEVERFYVSEVSLKESQLTDYEVDEDIFEEVELLKVEFEQLKEEMKNSGDPMKVVEAMIYNYQLRLEILQDILDQLERERENELHKNEKDENFV